MGFDPAAAGAAHTAEMSHGSAIPGSAQQLGCPLWHQNAFLGCVGPAPSLCWAGAEAAPHLQLP